ncbi:DM13 domain-containing protein [Streptomyces sp. NPDC056529]|uniref:DM13 domain-containing protein n=1 Tax=Streptomyces sp. NPDC056529 TaxID=3345855 RepID=UPI003690A970
MTGEDGSHRRVDHDGGTGVVQALRVRLSDAPVKEGEACRGVFDDGKYGNLTKLKGNKGDQNYLLPAEHDLSAYTNVSIWCEGFNVPFGAAEIVRSLWPCSSAFRLIDETGLKAVIHDDVVVVVVRSDLVRQTGPSAAACRLPFPCAGKADGCLRRFFESETFAVDCRLERDVLYAVFCFLRRPVLSGFRFETGRHSGRFSPPLGRATGGPW